MTRFRKGTTDHDNDGKMGGSLKETDMTTKKKADAETKADSAPEEGGDTPLVEMEAAARAAADTPKQKRAEFNRLFAEADAEAQAAITDELQTGQQVRGY